MHYLVEDPTYLLVALGMAGAALLVALRVTQQGKFLIWAGVVAAVAAGLLLFERSWVTDAERIEAVVYRLAEAVGASDVDAIKAHLDDRVAIGIGGRTLGESLPLRVIFPLLRRTRFDFVRVGHLTTRAMDQARRGSAEFSVSATGVYADGGSEFPLGSVGTEWSLGFREASPGVWKVNRITAVKVPQQVERALNFGR